ncbi:two-component system response regulator (stage 0 sporulation protein F) [Rossellomorea aquimaris]|uniref:Two-component system response regulator (Stage 0 sporulation protein F) n=2 Tax=Rossellomorea aquimaris TaxID=189382 RepID=A0A366ER83_9BACI|nr:two-component system response regulator (stage 0 sporulation protein F) [Rossellomorea aquimaris]
MNEKILIVDDQFGIRILLNEVLQKEGYQTFQAANGIQALEIVDQHSPDLVLLDMKIPGMDGIEILKRMKQKDADIRVIIMTAYGELDMIQEAKDLGALTHFAKPFDIDDIRQAVKQYIPAWSYYLNSENSSIFINSPLQLVKSILFWYDTSEIVNNVTWCYK